MFSVRAAGVKITVTEDAQHKNQNTSDSSDGSVTVFSEMLYLFIYFHI